MKAIKEAWRVLFLFGVFGLLALALTAEAEASTSVTVAVDQNLQILAIERQSHIELVGRHSTQLIIERNKARQLTGFVWTKKSEI